MKAVVTSKAYKRAFRSIFVHKIYIYISKLFGDAMASDATRRGGKRYIHMEM